MDILGALISHLGGFVAGAWAAPLVWALVVTVRIRGGSPRSQFAYTAFWGLILVAAYLSPLLVGAPTAPTTFLWTFAVFLALCVAMDVHVGVTARKVRPQEAA